MAIFKIEGGHRLSGTITPQGAKNEALQIICAVLLTPKKVRIENIPNIIDVNKLIFILGELGVKIEKHDVNTYTFQADDLNLSYPLSKNWNAYVFNELFLNLDRGKRFVQNWTGAGLVHTISKSLKFKMGYFQIKLPNSTFKRLQLGIILNTNHTKNK